MSGKRYLFVEIFRQRRRNAWLENGHVNKTFGSNPNNDWRPWDYGVNLMSIFSITAITLATLSSYKTSFINSEPQVTLQAQSNKAFDKSCLIETFKITSGNIAECLEHCLENCRCQSFQICNNTKCQLCSSNKEDNGSLLHDNVDCIYAVYTTRPLQVRYSTAQE